MEYMQYIVGAIFLIGIACLFASSLTRERAARPSVQPVDVQGTFTWMDVKPGSRLAQVWVQAHFEDLKGTQHVVWLSPEVTRALRVAARTRCGAPVEKDATRREWETLDQQVQAMAPSDAEVLVSKQHEIQRRISISLVLRFNECHAKMPYRGVASLLTVDGLTQVVGFKLED